MADILPFKPGLRHAHTQDDESSEIARPCPFCGERENLFLGEEEKHLATFPDGSPMIMEVIPTVFCDLCDASAPLSTWNGDFSSPKERA